MFKLFKNDSGVALFETIITVALMGVSVPVAGYIDDSFEGSDKKTVSIVELKEKCEELGMNVDVIEEMKEENVILLDIAGVEYAFEFTGTDEAVIYKSDSPAAEIFNIVTDNYYFGYGYGYGYEA